VPNYHEPVLVPEVLAGMNVRSGGRYVDGTCGGGGHGAAILATSSPNGWYFGCDRDGDAVEEANRRLSQSFKGRFEIERGNFADLGEMLEHGSCDGVLLDLGVSSAQLDRAERGFSFQQDGPLDARMDTQQSLTAADLVNGLSVEELAKIFWELGEEPQARRIARAIETERRARRFTTTGQLAGLIERLAPRRGKRIHPATKVFQALRMAVNDELGSLRRGLEGAMKVLKPGGRLVVISFHGLENSVVKEFGRERAREYEFAGPVDVPELRRPRKPELKWVQRKTVKPGAVEIAENPRSRSAQMRVMEKI
jgi:16S rRNA (cytosine1402-N4)-methyltransferase